MKFSKIINALSLAAAAFFIGFGAYNFARGDREAARSFFVIGLFATFFFLVRLVMTPRIK